MFCPRCGRPVNETANFCCGCGLPRAEIMKINEVKPVQQAAPAPETLENELNSTLSRLETQLNATDSVTDYTTEKPEDTTDVLTPSDFIQQEIAEEKKNTEFSYTAGQSEYSRNAPQYPQYSYTQPVYTAPQPVEKPAEEKTEAPVSTVDFIWMMLISSIPVAGLFYLLYLGFFQTDSTTKKSFARAMLIISVFSFLLAFVFFVGLFATQISMFY